MKYSILIVEDSKIIGSLLMKNLKEIFVDSTIEWTQNIADSKEILLKTKFDYIVLDIFLPDGEGTSIIEWSKSLSDFKSKYIIFTNSDDENLKDKMFSSGVLDFILKTGNIKNVAYEIKKLISRMTSYKNFNILVVDDSYLYRVTLRNIFISRNYNVILANDGKEALETLKNNNIDLILMDLNMPNMDGREFLFARRKNPEIYQIPIIMITGENEKGLVASLLRAGANDVIQKPFANEEIIMKVNNLVELMIFQKDKERLTKELEINIERLNGINYKLSKYLSPQLYASIFESKQSNNSQIDIESKRKKLTIFFSDIKDFTQTTEAMEAEDLTFLLNSYLTEMSAIAIQYGATIDKFIGDAIVAFFGDPTTNGAKEDAILAINMAIAMRERLKELMIKWNNEGFTKPFQVRMGINTGYATVGNFGSENKMEYTAIGSSVNLTARIEARTEPNEIYISNETYLLVKDEFKCIHMGNIKAKGITNDVPVYKVLGLHDKNTISVKSDGFYVNVDFNNIKDIEKKNLTELLEYIGETINNTHPSCDIDAGDDIKERIKESKKVDKQ
jgi:class 3 adenylate cyclase/DNA-binding response OmpR family regulator